MENLEIVDYLVDGEIRFNTNESNKDWDTIVELDLHDSSNQSRFFLRTGHGTEYHVDSTNYVPLGREAINPHGAKLSSDLFKDILLSISIWTNGSDRWSFAVLIKLNFTNETYYYKMKNQSPDWIIQKTDEDHPPYTHLIFERFNFTGQW